MDAPGSPAPKRTVQDPPKLPAGHPAPVAPLTVLRKHKPEESRYQGRKPAQTAPTPNGGPQKVYIVWMLLGRVAGRLRESGSVIRSCPVIQAGCNICHLHEDGSRYPSFLSEVMPPPPTGQTSGALLCLHPAVVEHFQLVICKVPTTPTRK